MDVAVWKSLQWNDQRIRISKGMDGRMEKTGGKTSGRQGSLYEEEQRRLEERYAEELHRREEADKRRKERLKEREDDKDGMKN